MNKDEIKGVIGNLKPDREMEQSLKKKILKRQLQQHKISFKQIAPIAASIILIICLVTAGLNFFDRSPDNKVNIVDSISGINIPKIELPKSTNALMDMIGLIVFQGKVYTQTDTRISPEKAEGLLGEKLGTTKGNLDEWSKQENYAVEFASSIGKQDVYAVKGYDKGFRIMTFTKKDGNVYSEFFECLNGITVKTGADVFGKLKMENNILSAKYESFDSWNYGKKQYVIMKQLQVLNSFVRELGKTVPNEQKSLTYLFDDNSQVNQRLLYITLNDGSEIQLRLFKAGYVFYSNSHIFFKMENQVFAELWSELQ